MATECIQESHSECLTEQTKFLIIDSLNELLKRFITARQKWSNHQKWGQD